MKRKERGKKKLGFINKMANVTRNSYCPSKTHGLVVIPINCITRLFHFSNCKMLFLKIKWNSLMRNHV